MDIPELPRDLGRLDLPLANVPDNATENLFELARELGRTVLLCQAHGRIPPSVADHLVLLQGHLLDVTRMLVHHATIHTVVRPEDVPPEFHRGPFGPLDYGPDPTEDLDG